ncbi:MAG: substrate-binding domain-containing protein [Bacteroidetes bacterium]|nr:substrate-binding domain-containing protein [Bacteroidota bacterium]
MRKILFGAVAIMLMLVACEPKRDKKGREIDGPTTGKLTVMVDEGYKPIVETSIDVFDSIYRLAKIDPLYVSEGEAINTLLKDSVQVIIITRKLNETELSYFKKRGFVPPSTPIAHDAVAFIIHPENRDTVFTVAQIRDLLSGKIKKWAELNPKSKLGNIQLVFDNALSGTVRYAQDSIAQGAPLPSTAYALKTNEEVIQYVHKNKHAIGIIAANWISDTDDKGVQKFRQDIRIADIAKEAGKEGYGPYQAYLITGDYPFKRTVYIINAQGRKGLGLGFASFLAGDSGQRIVLKAGLVPAQAPTRLIKATRK